MADDKKISDGAKKVVTGFENIAGAVAKNIPILGNLGQELGSMAKTFQDLSNTGNSFNNDMVAMRVAAANARLSLDEYSKVLQENTKNNAALFTGLGGSVSQGTKAFGDFSKAFFESNLTENLRQMGYTSKDLNELLATQIGFQKASTDNTIEGQARTAKAAAELGAEMDLVAKLTGVSRREQEEKLKKAQVDGQIESKFRLIGLEQGAEAEKAARENYAKQLVQAQAMGQDQLFKEFFATGTATSKDAQMQLALFGDASMKTAESAKELSYANIEASKSAMENAKQANMANQSNRALLTLGAIGVGDAAKAVAKNVEINDAAYQGLKTFMKGTEDVTEAMKLQRDAIIEEQQKRAGLTQVMITAQARMQDFEAGLTSIIGTVIKNSEQARDPKTGKATGALSALGDLSQKVPGSTGGKTNEQLAKEYIESNGQLARNIAPMMVNEIQKRGYFEDMKKIDAGLVNIVEKGVKYLPEIANTLKDIKNLREEARDKDKKDVPKREGGSIEEAGRLFEDWGKGTMAELHGLEAVVKPDQMMNFAKGMGQQGASIAFNNMKGMLAGQEKGKGIDISKLGNEIKTTVSKVEITNWPKDIISKVEIKAPPSKPAETKPAETKPAETKPAETKPSEAQSRTEKAAKAAEEITIKSGDTLTSLAKKYNTSIAELMKANPAIKDANRIIAGAKLTIPGQEKKGTGNEDAAKKAQTETEQAQIKQQEQEKKFRQIGIEKGEEAEKKAREDYTKQKAQEEAVSKARDDELKARIIGIREGTEAEKKFRDTLKQQTLESVTTKTSETKVTVNGKNVDPNSPEGQAAIKQMDAVKANLEKSMGSMFHLTKDRLADLAKANLTELKNTQTKTSETKVTINGKDVDPNSKEGQAVLKQMEDSKARLETMMTGLMNGVVEKRSEPKERRPEVKISEMPNFDNFIAKLQGKLPINFESKNTETKLTVNGKNVDPNSTEGKEAMAQLDEAKSRMFSLFGNIKTNFEDVEKVSKDTNAELKTVFTDMVPIKEMQGQQSEFRSKFTDEQKKFIDDYQGMSKDNQEFMTFALKRQHGIDAEIIEKHDAIVADLQKKKNERELTEEEEARLAESEMISAGAKEDYAKRQQQLDMIKNIGTLADDLDLERLDQQARKELELLKGLDAEKLDATKAANDLIQEQFLLANDAILDSVGGMTDAAIAAQDVFMQEINALFDMPVDAATEAQDALIQEANALFDMPVDAATEAQDALMQEANALFDMPVDSAAEHQQALLEEANALFDMPSEAVADAQDAFMQEANALFDMPERDEFTEDEYGEGGEAIGGEMDSAFAEDEYSALEDLTNQIQGLKEFEQDEYGEGGEDVVLPEEQEEDYISLAMKDFADQVVGLKEFEQDEYGEGGEDVVLPEEQEEDYISLAMKDFADQVAGLKDFTEDEYGEGGEAIGGEMDSAFAEDEDDYVKQALQSLQDQIPDAMEYSDDMRAGEDIKPIATGTDSMADDAAYAAGPGDASVAGIDVAPAMNDLTKSLPQAQPLSSEPPKSKPQYSKIDMGGFTLGPDGLPIAKPKAQGQAAANAVKQEKDNKKAEDKKAAEAKNSEPDKKEKDSDKKQGEGDKPKKTLDDVVKSLDQLNMNIGKLTSKVEESAKQQVQATKSLNGNLYNV